MHSRRQVVVRGRGWILYEQIEPALAVDECAVIHWSWNHGNFARGCKTLDVIVRLSRIANCKGHPYLD